MTLKNKRVLITAGPTWIPIDKVRVISNIATGETGILLAEKLQNLGAKVSLLLGPTGDCCLDKDINLVRFRFFDELKKKIIYELKNKKYDMVIHSAAVADYKPAKVYNRKIVSDIISLQLNLVPTEKIIDLIRKINPTLFLVGFKFEPAASKNILIKKTKELIRRANLDLAVANSIHKNRYQAYVVDHGNIYGPMFNKRNMVERLVKILTNRL